MQKKNQKILKITIIAIIIIIILLLLILLKNHVNSQDKNQLALYENTPTMLVGSKFNAPKLSAGMIPIKWNGENFVITTKDDKDWYNTQPAYIMLNDGYYKSELERGITEDQLATKSVGMTIDYPEDLGTIFMWVPRFVYNAEGEIGYIKEEITPR